MKVREIITRMRNEAQTLCGEAETINTTRAAREDPTANAEETERLAAIDTRLVLLQAQIAAETERETRLIGSSVAVVEDDPYAAIERAAAPQSAPANLPKAERGIAFARAVHAQIMARGNPYHALLLAREKPEWRNTPEVVAYLRAATTAATTTNLPWAGNLTTPSTLTTEFIEMVYPQTIFGRMVGKHSVPFNMRINRQTANAVAAWVGEGMSKPVSSMAFDFVTLPFAKVATIVPFTEEVQRFSSPAIEGLVRKGVEQACIQVVDASFVDNVAGSAIRPAGLQAAIPAGHKFPSTGVTVAAITADLSNAISLATASGYGLQSPYWIMNPANASYLSLVRTSQDLFAFRDEMSSGTPKLLGIPVLTSTLVPKTMIFLVDAAQLMVADEGGINIDASREACLQMDTVPTTPPTAPLVSLWQQNMVAIKAERFIYWMIGNAVGDGLAEITAVAYVP